MWDPGMLFSWQIIVRKIIWKRHSASANVETYSEPNDNSVLRQRGEQKLRKSQKDKKSRQIVSTAYSNFEKIHNTSKECFHCCCTDVKDFVQQLGENFLNSLQRKSKFSPKMKFVWSENQWISA